MQPNKRIQWIKDQLAGVQPTTLIIHDDSAKHAGHEGAKGGAGHFSIEIASPLFEQKTLIECHRMIYGFLEGAIPTKIHALKIKIIRS